MAENSIDLATMDSPSLVIDGGDDGHKVQLSSGTEQMAVSGDSVDIAIAIDGQAVGRLVSILDHKDRWALRMEAVDTRTDWWRPASEVTRRGRWVEQDPTSKLHVPYVDGKPVHDLAFATEMEAVAALTALQAAGAI